MIGETAPRTCRRVKRSASGKSSQKTSRHRSPPRIPVSQSWTSATLMAGAGGARSARGGPGPLAPVAQQVPQGALEGDLHLPAHHLFDFGGVALEPHDIGGAQAGRIGLY